MNTRRQFLFTASMGVMAATGACGTQTPSSSGPAPASPAATLDPGGAAHVRHRAGDRSARVGGDVRRGREARADHDAPGGSRAGGFELAAIARAAARAADRVRARSPSSRTWPPRPSGRRRSSITRRCADARRVRAQPRRRDTAARERRRHRVCPGHRALALDRAEADHLRSPHAHLPAAHRRARSAKLRVGDHQDRGSCARAGEAGRRRDRRRPLSRPACTAFPTA